MKLQSLAVIFVIIIIPITIVLSEYIDKKIDTEKLELEYNTRLLNSTHDAIKAYQLNTVSNAFGDVADLKIKDVESAAKTFLNSISSNFNYTGYNNNTIREYVPAVVFTMYDGYYIYAPFNNTLTEVERYDEEFSKDGEIKSGGLKPYVYYSCRYKRGDSDDFIITYTLDNYITIQGLIKGEYIYDYGYIYPIVNSQFDQGIYKKNDTTYCYDGIEFKKDDTEEMKEYVGEIEYSYVKINGKKYYLDENYYTEDRGSEGDETTVTYKDQDGSEKEITFKSRSAIFFLDSDGTKNYNATKGYSDDNRTEENENFLKYYRAIKENKSGYEYYKNAYEFSKAVLGTPVNHYHDKSDPVREITTGYGLDDLNVKDAIFYSNTDDNITALSSYGEFNIFEDKIQYENSNFNRHRKAIIRYVVESNLSSAITSFQSNAKNVTFLMPKISETDWEIIENDVCAISFLQGMSIGTKKYNGYSVVANTLTNEHIDENDIYFITTDNTYCRVNDDSFKDNPPLQLPEKDTLRYYPGIWKLNFELRKDVSSGTNTDYIPMSYNYGTRTGYLGSYTSIMGSSRINELPDGDMYKYAQTLNIDIKRAYYYALGRERHGSFNINNVNYELNKSNSTDAYFLKDYSVSDVVEI